MIWKRNNQQYHRKTTYMYTTVVWWKIQNSYTSNNRKQPCVQFVVYGDHVKQKQNKIPVIIRLRFWNKIKNYLRINELIITY